MTNEAYEASLFKVTQRDSNVISEISERIEGSYLLPIEVVFMLGGEFKVKYYISGSGYYGGIARVKDSSGNVIGEQEITQNNSSLIMNLVVNPFEKYSFEFEPEEGYSGVIKSAGLYVSGHLCWKKRILIKG